MKDRYCAGIVFAKMDVRDAAYWAVGWANLWAARKPGRQMEIIRQCRPGRADRIGIALIAPLSEITE